MLARCAEEEFDYASSPFASLYQEDGTLVTPLEAFTELRLAHAAPGDANTEPAQEHHPQCQQQQLQQQAKGKSTGGGEEGGHPRW